MLYGILFFVLLIFLIVKFGDRDLDKAIERHKKHREKHPEFYEVTYNLEKIIEKEFNLKNNQFVIECSNKLLLLEPDNYIALTCRASSLSNLGYYLNSIHDYQKALKNITRRRANDIGLLGMTYYKIGEIYLAKKYLSVAVRLGAMNHKLFLDILNESTEESIKLMREKNSIEDNLKWENDLFSVFFWQPAHYCQEAFMNNYSFVLRQRLEQIEIRLGIMSKHGYSSGYYNDLFIANNQVNDIKYEMSRIGLHI